MEMEKKVRTKILRLIKQKKSTKEIAKSVRSATPRQIGAIRQHIAKGHYGKRPFSFGLK